MRTPKRVVSHRLHERTCERLADLARRSRMSPADVIERLVDDAWARARLTHEEAPTPPLALDSASQP